jgi:hypothetical protein
MGMHKTKSAIRHQVPLIWVVFLSILLSQITPNFFKEKHETHDEVRQ